MLMTSKNPNMVDGDELSLHRLSSPAADGVERKDNFRFSTLIPFRTTFEKILAVVAFVLFIICIIVIALLVMEKNSGPRNAGQTEDTTCLYSEEARRVGLPDFLEKVQKAYYKYNRYNTMPQPLNVKETHVPFDCTPEYLKEKTDAALSLLNEINETDMDENKMKPREVKGVEQVKLFLRTVFGTPYDQNFYDGDWLLGPNHFCWQSVCYIGPSLRRYPALVKPENLIELEEMLRRIRLYGKMLKQYKSNMKSGVKAGMVRSEFSCRSGLDAFESRFKKISKQNNPKDVLKEWFVKDYLKASFIKNISKADRENWLKSKGKDISASISDALVEGVGKPIVDLIKYIKEEHLRHCLPQDLSSGFASLPVSYVYVNGNRTTERTTRALPLTGQPLSGKNSYKNILPYFTTSEITPEDINKLGQEMLNVLYPQAIEIAKNVTGASDDDTAIREFKMKLNASEQFFNSEPFPANESDTAAHKNCSDVKNAKKYCPKRWAAMQRWSSYTRETMGMLAPKLIPLFYHVGKNITVPNCPIEMNSDFNPSSAAQSFNPAGGACVQPAYYNLPFFLNNYGPKFSDWSVTAHEGWPGHHTQSQGREEYFQDKCGGVLKWLDDTTYYTFFSEGWALYAENPLIAEDTDTYKGNLMQKYGMLQWQIWRALRLITDTGLHYRGMNRTETLGLFSKYAWDDTDLSQKEVTRYQGVPGQATAYMLGQQKLVQLRKYCKNKLGDRFSLQSFHYQILSQGSAPESYLDKHVKKYVKCVLGELKGENCDIILNPPKQTHAAGFDSTLGHLPPMPSQQRYV